MPEGVFVIVIALLVNKAKTEITEDGDWGGWINFYGQMEQSQRRCS